MRYPRLDPAPLAIWVRFRYCKRRIYCWSLDAMTGCTQGMVGVYAFEVLIRLVTIYVGLGSTLKTIFDRKLVRRFSEGWGGGDCT